DVGRVGGYEDDEFTIDDRRLTIARDDHTHDHRRNVQSSIQSVNRRSSMVNCAAVIDRSCRHLTSWVRLHVSSGIAATRSFDKQRDFVLDTKEISLIIYIWYEGGWLSPPVVTATRSVGGWVANPEEKTMAKKAAKGAQKKA